MRRETLKVKRLLSSSLLILAFLPALILSIQPVSGQGVGVPKLIVSSVYWGANPMVPLTASPGDKDLTLSIIVTNVGDDYARDVKGTLRLQYPFRHEYYLDGEVHSAESISRIAGDIAAGRSFTFQYTLSIDGGAREGVYRLPLELTYRSARILRETSETIQVDVPVWRGEIHIQSTGTTPPKVHPGDAQVALTVFIVNSGSGSVNDLKVSIGVHPPFKRSSTGSDESFIGTIRPGQVAQVRFLLDVSSDAEPGNYPLELYAVEGSNRSLIGVIPFTIAEKARLKVVEVTPTTVRAGDSGVTLKVTVRNEGGVKAESVRVRLLAGNYFSGTLSDLLGTLNPGEERTAFFLVDVDGKAPPGDYTVDLRLEWTQDGVYSLNDTLPVNITVSKWTIPLILIVSGAAAVILLGAAASLHRRRKTGS